MHTSTNGKHVRSESTHSPSRAQTPDVLAHEGELAEGTGSAEENQVPDPPEQGPPTSLHVEMLDLDERADSPYPECGSSPSLLRQDPVDRQDSMCSPDLGLSDENGQQEDDNTVLGREAQPDDVPDGLYDWSQEDIVPRLETLCVSIEFIKGLKGASLDRDPILDDVRARLRFPSTMHPHINVDLQMCIGIFMETLNSSQATYDSICQFIKQRYPDTHTWTYDQMK